MTALHSAATTPQRTGRTAQRARKEKPVERILAAIDGSERGNAIVDYLSKLAKSGCDFEVIVLNVQPLSGSFRLRGYGSFKHDEIRDRLVSDLGMPIVRGVGRRLQKSGIAFTTQVEIGDPADVIMQHAAASRCDLIVLGDPQPSALRRWIARTTGVSFGSVAGQVAQLSKTPLVIAK